ncbi:DegT/DnrJ/EryC1/StrS family aminotransferase [Sporosarcina sp. 179-K 3D1 HS]|uniref:DegT/DnrJ/EryC1/StrS family aminotransferase n=1 Tax=Sporosarcina sp. 179-K 3D1 HS TaxID=3232169 RepID=UPI0039A1C48C
MKWNTGKTIHLTRPLLPSVDRMTERLQTIWQSGWITNNGSQHGQLERELRHYLGAEHIALFNNGTLALLLGLKALDLTGEIITTPFTFPATVQAIDWNGLTPVFCDIEPETLTIDPTKIEALVTEQTSAILAVHVYGNPCKVEEIQKIADKYGLKVIYDGAHTFGTKWEGRPIGNYGDMTMFSFHATKLFNTIEGGALVFKDGQLAGKLASLKNFGLSGPEEVVLSGLNAKLNEVQAAMGLEVLKLVKEERRKRAQVKQQYDRFLADIPGVRILTSLEGEQSSYQYYVIEIDEALFGASRNDVHEWLNEHAIMTRKYFSPLCSDFPWYAHLPSAQREELPQANRLVSRVLALPYYGELELDVAKAICEVIRQFQSTVSRAAQLRLEGELG